MKTVVTDLDGTLLSHGQLSEKTIQVCHEFQKQNCLILATGRNFESAERIFKQLKMDQYQSGALILLNGLAFYDFKDREYCCLDIFDKKTAKWIVKVAYCLFFRVTIVNKEQRIQMNCFYDKIYDFLRYLIKHKPMRKRENGVLPQYIEKIELGGTIFFEFFYRILRLVLKKYEVVRVSQYWIEILPKGTNKVNQLKYYMEKYHISMEDVYVFGDGENDIDMLKSVKHSYAMKNALPHVKQFAHHECLTCDQDGVALQLEKLLK